MKLQSALALAIFAIPVSADVITEWNETYLDVIRVTGGAPCPISRSGPMLNVAMYDAVNSIDRITSSTSYQPYQQALPAPEADSSREAAAATAAWQVMSALHQDNPTSVALINARYASQLAAIADSPGKAHGISFGTTVASSLMALRANDGYDAASSYAPGTHAGDWNNTPDGPFVPAFSPHWGNVQPWSLTTGSQFRPTRLTNFGSMDNLMHSPEYAEQINGSATVPGVKPLGSRFSSARTADETQAAWFWANDRDGTSKPPGQLIQLTQIVSNQQQLSLSENARLFGLVGLGLGDACIAAWDAKYNTDIDLWRPVSAIRETLDDGNAATICDPAWLPLNDFTPPFPAYVSGHATFAAVHAAIMAQFFGTDNITFTLGSDEFSVHPELGYAPDTTRTFTSFSQAAWENAMSRVWLGVHYEWDATDGNTLGYDVGNYIYANYLTPIPEPTTAAIAISGACLIHCLATPHPRRRPHSQPPQRLPPL